MGAALLLDRLQHVRQVAPGRWMAACPVHNKNGRALSIRELEDGRVLIHDFGGCDTHDVLAAIGMCVGDLFPDRLGEFRATKPSHWHARKEAFESIHFECLLVALAAETLAAGVPLSEQDRDRLMESSQRTRHAVEVCR